MPWGSTGPCECETFTQDTDTGGHLLTNRGPEHAVQDDNEKNQGTSRNTCSLTVNGGRIFIRKDRARQLLVSQDLLPQLESVLGVIFLK